MFFKEYCKRLFSSTHIIIAIISVVIAVIIAIVAANLIHKTFPCMVVQVLCFSIICAMVPSISAEGTRINKELEDELKQQKQSHKVHHKKKK